MKILVVDDEMSILTLFRDVLEGVGHEVDIAIDGRAGLEKFKNKKYDIVVMDHRMHGRNGMQISKEMWRMDKNAKILFVSADSTIREKAMKMGASGFLLKPLDIDRIIKEIEALK